MIFDIILWTIAAIAGVLLVVVAARYFWDDEPLNVPRPGGVGTDARAGAGAAVDPVTAGPGHPGQCGKTAHNIRAISTSACPNCGRPAYDGKVCGACGWGFGWQPVHEAQVAAIFAPGVLPETDPAPPAEMWLSPPRTGRWLPARPRIRIPVADTALDVLTRDEAAWLRELLARPDTLGGRSVDEYIAAARQAS
jgi:ribosomal protein L32